MQINRFDRLLTLFIILLAHSALIVVWQSTKSTFDNVRNTDKILLFIAIPKISSVAIVSSAQPVKKALSRSPVKATNIEKPRTSAAITSAHQTSTNYSAPEINSPVAPLQKDIRDLSMSLKDDFVRQEKNFRPEQKSLNENMKKFSNAMSDAAQIPREGVIIEKKFAYDGRPVSKVKTPYGTYCVRHPKAGEKLELSPPPLPVTCGQL
ncbi:hypothetical protein [Undibacterium sp. Ji22W]|uniref:hypothetical protein n=1 Tax=Undibacterium sp. Ji22W TaxID=3413038 RepID=UPI003BF0603D